MAVLWRKNRAGTRYEVRAAGETRRLYANGVLHSAYNPRHPSTGDIWDLLMLPALMVPAKSVLVLGVGGGSVIKLLNQFVHPDRIVAIERDPVHLYVARRFFKADADNVELIEDDAIAWLHRNRRRFDVVIDDLFGHASGEPARALLADDNWYRALERAVSKRGVLTINFDTPSAHRDAAPEKAKTITHSFESAIRFATAANNNIVTSFFRGRVTPADMKGRLTAIPELDPRRSTTRLRCAVRRLSLTA